jgi:hypothetical protein
MIRFINCVRRRRDVSIEDFRHYWKSPEFEALYDRLVAILEPYRCARNLTLQVNANELVREERGSGEPFDATIEFWWKDANQLLQKYDSPEALKIREDMLAYQEQFLDMPGCRAFFTEYE